MHYSEVVPAEPLRGLVRCFWFLSGPKPAGAETAPALPDGSPELIFHLGDRFIERIPGGRLQPRTVFVGQITGPFPIGPTGAVDVVGVRFESAGARGLVGRMSTLSDRWIPADDLDTTSLRPVWNRLANTATRGGRVAILEAALQTALGRRPSDGRTAAAVAAIRRSGGRRSIDSLVRELNLSRRHLERRFAAEVGIPPKLLARIVRFQRALQEADRPGSGWTAIAARCGYYDQSHLVRDFRDFAGTTPTGFQAAGENDFTRLFIER